MPFEIEIEIEIKREKNKCENRVSFVLPFAHLTKQNMPTSLLQMVGLKKGRGSKKKHRNWV
jgi:hypothetical protein